LDFVARDLLATPKRGDVAMVGRATGINGSTLKKWRAGDIGALPNGDQLLRLGLHTRISIDWLLGFRVPKDRRKRELATSLAPALVQHVFHELSSRREGRRYVGDIVAVLGGGEIALDADGETILRVPEPASFLARVCDWAAAQVAEKSRDADTDEANLVRQTAFDLLNRVGVLDEARRRGRKGLTRTSDAKLVLSAAHRAPLSSGNQRRLRNIAKDVATAEAFVQQQLDRERASADIEKRVPTLPRTPSPPETRTQRARALAGEKVSSAELDQWERDIARRERAFAAPRKL
jgi:hypothetical protein